MATPIEGGVLEGRNTPRVERALARASDLLERADHEQVRADGELRMPALARARPERPAAQADDRA